MNEALASRIFNATVRIEAIWPMPAHQPSEQMMEAFEYNDCLPDPLNDLIGNWPDHEREGLFEGIRGEDAWEELAAAMARKGMTGYLCYASYPVYQKSGSGVSFSWGHTTSGFFFAETAEEAIAAACQWTEADYQSLTERCGHVS